jgi:hypothetical protein
MTEMIERVARAIYEADPSYIQQSGWDDVPEARRAQYRRQARAAIGAMREPTEEMRDVLSVSFEVDDVATYRAMISAALKAPA